MVRLRLLLALAALLAGCLKEGRPVVGRSLVPGRAVEKPGFVKGGQWVTYEVRRKPAEAPYAGSYDFSMVNYDSGETRLLAANVSDQWGRADNDLGLYFMVTDETLATDPLVPTTMGVLNLVDLDQGVIDRIADVTSFSILKGSREFFYRKAAAAGGDVLHYRSEAGADRELGTTAGPVQFIGKHLYYVVGKDPKDAKKDKIWTRFTRPDGTAEVLRTKVNRFLLNADESWAILQTSDAPAMQAIARQLDTGVEHVIPATANSYWFDFGGNLFRYVESATATAPAKIHTYNVATEEHTVSNAPAQLVDVRDVRGRPGTTDRLFFDSRGQMAVVHDGDVDGNVITGTPVQLTVTEDGRYALWIELTVTMPPQGRLMIQDLDFKDPPRVLSPKGGLLPVPGYFFIPDGERRILVFWAQFGHNGVDLYYADHETGENRVVAEGISEVVVTPFQVVGIVRVSEQDLIGDLVNKDLALEKEIVLAHEVADEAIYGDRVVFVIRERVSSERDGLWAIGIDGTPPDAGIIGR
jgi:hypothetical protein